MNAIYDLLRLGDWGLAPWAWAVFGLTAFLVGFSKMGLPGVTILAVPLMAAIFPAKLSVGLLLPMLMMGDVISVLAYRHFARWRYCFPYLLFVGLGVGLASLVAESVDGAAFRVLIGWIVLLLLLLTLVADAMKSRGANEAPPAESPSLAASAAFGCPAGFFSALANAAGPIIALYMLVSRLRKFEFIGTTAVCTFFMNWFKIPLFVSLGMIDARTLSLDAAALPLVVLGGIAGRLFAKKVPQRAFKNLVLLLALGAAVKLIAG